MENCLSFIKTTFRTKHSKLGLNQSNQLNLPITLYIQVPVNFYEWLEELCKIIKVALTKELGKKAKLLYKIKMENMAINNRLRNNYQVTVLQ
jgi:chromosomal replication initiator protein